MKKFIIIFLFILLVTILLTLLLPTILSTSWGSSIIKKAAYRFTGKTITFERLHLRWFGKQEVDNFYIDDPDKKISAGFKKGHIDSSLFKLAVGSLKGEEGSLEIEQGSAAFLRPEMPSIRAEEVHVSVKFSNQKPLVFKAEGTTLYDSSIKGLFSIEGSFAPLSHALSAEVTLSHFPTALLDQAASLSYPFLSEKILETIGPFVEAKISLNESPLKGDFSLLLQSEKVNIEASSLLKEEKLLAFKLKSGPLQLEGISIEPFTLQTDVDPQDSTLFHTTLDSTQLKISPIDIVWKEGITLKNPLTFSGALEGSLDALHIPKNSEDINVKGSLKTNLPLFSSPLNIGFSVEGYKTIDLSLQGSDLKMHLKGSINPKTLRFKGAGEIETITLHEITLQNLFLKLDAGKNAPLIKASLHSEQISGELSMISPEEFTLRGELSNFPLESLVSQIPTKLPFDPLLFTGETISGPFSLTQKKEQKELFFKVVSPLLKASGNIAIDTKNLSFSKPFELTWKPLKEEIVKGLVVTPASSLELVIPSFNSPLASSDFLSEISLDGVLKIQEISYKEIPLSSLLLNVHQKPQEDVAFNLTAYANKGANKGKIESQGLYARAKNALSLHSSIEALPLKLLDWIPLALGEKALSLSGILGETLQGSIDGEISAESGYFKASFRSPFSTASFGAEIKKGILTLSEPLYAQIKMTPALSRYLLKNVSSSAVSALYADAPLSLKIDPFQFSLPLFPLQPKFLSIGYGRIELGKLFCENKGNVNLLLSLLKLGQFSADEKLELWFSPIEFHVKDQVVTLERTDILIAQNYPICSWGTIDLTPPQVDMILGLTAECLTKAFKIPNLPDSYVLQIPVTGPLSNIEINKAKATAKIAALLIWQQKGSAGGLVGGNAGALVGKFLDKLGPLPDQNLKAPPPRKPLPWDQETEEAKPQPKSKKKKTKFSEGESPLKQALKIVK